jgi:hypothetical protein
MTTQQIAWARKHDWFICTSIVLASSKVRIHVKDDRVEGNTLGFTDFEALKQWAGY